MCEIMLVLCFTMYFFLWLLACALLGTGNTPMVVLLVITARRCPQSMNAPHLTTTQAPGKHKSHEKLHEFFLRKCYQMLNFLPLVAALSEGLWILFKRFVSKVISFSCGRLLWPGDRLGIHKLGSNSQVSHWCINIRVSTSFERWSWQGYKTEIFREKHVAMLLCPPQTLCGLVCNWIAECWRIL
jgi:hypothetical protein